MEDKEMYLFGALIVVGGGALAIAAAKKKKAAEAAAAGTAAAASTGNAAEFPDQNGKFSLPTGTGPGTPAAQAAAAQVPPAAEAAAALAAGVDPNVLAAAAAAAGTTVASVLAAAQNANPGADPAATAAQAAATLAASANLQAAINPQSGGQLAVVTTNDPAPSGDLIIRDAPDGTQIGGAEKGGSVLVLDAIDPSSAWAHIAWAGGTRLGPATGFAHKSALKLL
jgi:hypothetical protein